MIVEFIDGHKDRFGVEPICRVLSEHGCKVAPSTYDDARHRSPSRRQLRDEQVKALITDARAADFTYVPTWSGMVYVAFVFDVFSRRILGWRAATHMTTPLVLDTLEMALWVRAKEGHRDLSRLVHHTELIWPHGPWRDREHVEINTLDWVHWFNTARPHQSLDDLIPLEAEQLHYTHRTSHKAG